MEPPDIVLVGHVTRDLLPQGGWRAGGSVVYGAHLAARWGFRPAVLTAAASPDEALAALPPGTAVEALLSPVTTTFRNIPGPPREQYVTAVASPLTAESLPAPWRAAAAALLAPVIGEVEPLFLRRASLGGISGVALQGWLRQIDATGRVRASDARAVALEAIVAGADAAFVSDEDLAGTPAAEALLRGLGRERTDVLLTLADRGARLFSDGGVEAIPPAPARAVDATGAGDVFAAAYLLGRVLGEAPLQAARLAAAAAACSVEGEGVAAIPTLEEARRRRRETEAA